MGKSNKVITLPIEAVLIPKFCPYLYLRSVFVYKAFPAPSTLWPRSIRSAIESWWVQQAMPGRFMWLPNWSAMPVKWWVGSNDQWWCENNQGGCCWWWNQNHNPTSRDIQPIIQNSCRPGSGGTSRSSGSRGSCCGLGGWGVIRGVNQYKKQQLINTNFSTMINTAK